LPVSDGSLQNFFTIARVARDAISASVEKGDADKSGSNLIQFDLRPTAFIRGSLRIFC